MSSEALIVCMLIIVALAGQSIRATLRVSKPERAPRLVALGLSGLIGAVVIGTLSGLVGEVLHEPELSSSAAWALGGIVGLATFELGPAVLSALKRLVRRRADTLNGESDKEE